MKENKYALGLKHSEKLMSEKNLYKSFTEIHKNKLSLAHKGNTNFYLKFNLYNYNNNLLQEFSSIKKLAYYLNISTIGRYIKSGKLLDNKYFIKINNPFNYIYKIYIK